MPDVILHKMRDLRRHSDHLRRTLIEDYRPFFKDETFFRLPTRPPESPDDIGVTLTCTALMSFCLGEKADDFFGTNGNRDALRDALDAQLKKLLDHNWITASLSQNNAFTAALVVRSAAMLARANLTDANCLTDIKRTVDDVEVRRDPVTKAEQSGEPIDDTSRKLKDKSVLDICKTLLTTAPEGFAVQKYPPTPTIAYWVVDGASMASGLELDQDNAKDVAEWASLTFAKRISLVASNHQSMMDPVSLAMSACLCRVLRRIARVQPAVHSILARALPTESELRAGVKMFFDHQNSAGVWGKYFPLFHYPDAGANHCWHFEVVEAILNEFPEMLTDESILDCLRRSLDWLNENRIEYLHGGEVYAGWNSGSDVRALESGEPESWPTGVAHMCLARLSARLSEQIHVRVLEKYKDQVQIHWKKQEDVWDDFLDCDVSPELGTVRNVFQSEIIEKAEHDIDSLGWSLPGDDPKRDPKRLKPSFELSERRSALLFGPPGTSKTTIAEIVAKRLGWPLLELSPSDFLRAGLDGIYNQVNEVFDDLLDLYGVVVLFDEMDALVQRRDHDEEGSDAEMSVEQKFLTTSMLPKILRLRKQARVIFFMATNHRKEFDSAIIRAGRLDMLILMGPPRYDEKIKRIDKWCKGEPDDKIEEARKRIEEWVTNTPQAPNQDHLGLFTYGEMKEFIATLKRETEEPILIDALEKLGATKLNEFISRWEQDKITLQRGSGERVRFEKEDKDASKLQ
ncbi:ATP-dependent zinc metalloprotease FtsH [Symmachiella dynata]|uniref:ATP-dependent zinc metalloprotease FtsH n=1 Tax=Symmachiella dynata TaxID=2527995 RepID=A0A517ZK46_9PLAN|nr:ATP-binding protein [Symmachiella dynata]QDU42851.1 ATP-dependent zinc metalloprotease FtsH [Symmachiella dynata]